MVARSPDETRDAGGRVEGPFAIDIAALCGGGLHRHLHDDGVVHVARTIVGGEVAEVRSPQTKGFRWFGHLVEACIVRGGESDSLREALERSSSWAPLRDGGGLRMA